MFPQKKVLHRLRPIVTLCFLDQSNNVHKLKGLLDSGADDTLLPLSWADKLGARFIEDPDAKATARGADVKGPKFEYGYAEVTMCLYDQDEAFIWPGVVGFSEIRDETALFGLSGVLEYFDVVFRSGFIGIEIHPGRIFQQAKSGFIHQSTPRLAR